MKENLDLCLYQTSFKVACPFTNSTCRRCPWSLLYRRFFAVRNRGLFSLGFIEDSPSLLDF